MNDSLRVFQVFKTAILHQAFALSIFLANIISQSLDIFLRNKFSLILPTGNPVAPGGPLLPSGPLRP